MPQLLVNNADNEFVGKLISALAEDHEVPISALVPPGSQVVGEWPGVEAVYGPGDETHVLLTMPTDAQAARRATDLVDDLDGDKHLVFIANETDPSHHEVMDHMKASGYPWTIVHPVAMMDFAFASLPPQISLAGVVFGISGHSRVGFVAASDIMRVLAAIIKGSGHEGQEYVCSGPQALDMPTVVGTLGEVLGRDLDYIDLPEDELRTLMIQYGKQDPDFVDRLVLSHLRAWRDGHGDTLTDTVEELTGVPPISVAEWFEKHRDDYGKGPGLAQKAAAKLVKARYRNQILAPADGVR